MSTLKLFAIRDNKVSAYLRPFADSNAIMAARSLHSATKDPKIQLSMYPEDFDLYELADFDDVTGVITPAVPAKFIVSAVSVETLVLRKDGPRGTSNPESL